MFRTELAPVSTPRVSIADAPCARADGNSQPAGFLCSACASLRVPGKAKGEKLGAFYRQKGARKGQIVCFRIDRRFPKLNVNQGKEMQTDWWSAKRE
jgi:hypothetical protein